MRRPNHAPESVLAEERRVPARDPGSVEGTVGSVETRPVVAREDEEPALVGPFGLLAQVGDGAFHHIRAKGITAEGNTDPSLDTDTASPARGVTVAVTRRPSRP